MNEQTKNTNAVKIGRVTKLDAEIIHNISVAIKTGITRKRAAWIGSISESSFYSWLKIAKEYQKMDIDDLNDEQRLYLVFLESVQLAEAELEQSLVEEVLAEPGGARFLLARRFREQWGGYNEAKNADDEPQGAFVFKWPDDVEPSDE